MRPWHIRDSYEDPVVPHGDPVSVEGQWSVAIHYVRGVGQQQFTLTQKGHALEGTQHGELYSAALAGEIHGNQIRLRSSMAVPGSTLDWDFTGIAQKDTMTGTVDMGEYGIGSVARISRRKNIGRGLAPSLQPIQRVGQVGDLKSGGTTVQEVGLCEKS